MTFTLQLKVLCSWRCEFKTVDWLHFVLQYFRRKSKSNRRCRRRSCGCNWRSFRQESLQMPRNCHATVQKSFKSKFFSSFFKIIKNSAIRVNKYKTFLTFLLFTNVFLRLLDNLVKSVRKQNMYIYLQN